MGSSSSPPALEIRSARLTFHRGTANERAALDGVDLALARGDFAVVIGGNGAGKSTLLNVIAGELSLDAGHVRVQGRDVTRDPTHRRAATIARVFQDPLIGTAGSMTIEENLSIAQRRGGRSGLRSGLTAQGREVYRERLARLGLGLEKCLSHKVELLSGGQRQSLALAMAVIKTPQVLLLDEHTAALDPRTAAAVMRATVEAVTGEGLTTLMVTHNMQHAIDHGNRLVMMSAGRIIYEAEGDEKKALSVQALLDRFHIASDRMLLA
jgi:putative ABC transport system ATP-binding protein